MMLYACERGLNCVFYLFGLRTQDRHIQPGPIRKFRSCILLTMSRSLVQYESFFLSFPLSEDSFLLSRAFLCLGWLQASNVCRLWPLLTVTMLPIAQRPFSYISCLVIQEKTADIKMQSQPSPEGYRAQVYPVKSKYWLPLSLLQIG